MDLLIDIYIYAYIYLFICIYIYIYEVGTFGVHFARSIRDQIDIRPTNLPRCTAIFSDPEGCQLHRSGCITLLKDSFGYLCR